MVHEKPPIEVASQNDQILPAMSTQESAHEDFPSSTHIVESQVVEQEDMTDTEHEHEIGNISTTKESAAEINIPDEYSTPKKKINTETNKENEIPLNTKKNTRFE
ncbi:hypothetical protein ABMA28_003634 [Loxostege sticticalis]|uniref:Uncharacterized protein n=1 Tax=Loxostege sticticalis TaxID=481309 RepID=A0ABD0SZ63_LOXSC